MTTSHTVNDAVKHAAATTRHAAATTAHTLSTLAGDAQQKLGELDLPVTRRRRRRSRGRWLVLLVLLGAVAVVVRKRTGARDDDRRDPVDSAPTPTPAQSPLTSVG